MITNNPKKILFVCDRLPYPARRDGLSIRYLPIIKALAEYNEVTLLSITTDPDSEALGAMSKICNEVIILSPTEESKGTSYRKKFLWALKYLNPASTPNSHYFYESDLVAELIIHRMRGRQFDCVINIWQRYADVFPKIAAGLDVKLVVQDYIDSPVLIHKRSIGIGFITRMLYGIEMYKLKRWERRLVTAVDLSIYISDIDANANELLNENAMTKVVVIPNGIYKDDFNVRPNMAEEYSMGFIGNMSYQPNIDAVLYLINEIFLPLYEKDQSISCVIVGRNPGSAIVKLGCHPGVSVTGEVDNVPEYLAKMCIAVFPMISGGGVQNKVLDALFAGKPVITTTIGNEGIDASDGEELIICDNPVCAQNSITHLLYDTAFRNRLGEKGKHFVVNKFSWEQIIDRYARFVLRQ